MLKQKCKAKVNKMPINNPTAIINEEKNTHENNKPIFTAKTIANTKMSMHKTVKCSNGLTSILFKKQLLLYLAFINSALCTE